MQLEFEWGDWIESAQITLFDDDQPVRVRWNCGTVTRGRFTKANFRPQYWENGAIDGFAIPAGHPYYAVTTAGFQYWPGGDAAPDDWGGGPVMLDNGAVGKVSFPDGWRRNRGDGKADIIGYSRADPAADWEITKFEDTPYEQPAYWAVTKAAVLIAAEPHGSGKMEPRSAAFARYIEAHEMPPVDPDVAAVRRVLATWNLNRDESVANQLLLGNFDDDGSFIAALDVYRGIKAGGQ